MDYQFESGWAVTPNYGRMYGKKYIGPFKKDILTMFQHGENDKRLRMGAARMLEKLKVKYPTRLDIPPESEIRQLITSTIAMNKRSNGESVTSKSIHGISQPYLSTIVRIFNNSNGQIMPKEACESFLKSHPPNDESSTHVLSYPSMKQVKSKISSLKAAFKKSNVLPFDTG